MLVGHNCVFCFFIVTLCPPRFPRAGISFDEYRRTEHGPRSADKTFNLPVVRNALATLASWRVFRLQMAADRPKIRGKRRRRRGPLGRPAGTCLSKRRARRRIPFRSGGNRRSVRLAGRHIRPRAPGHAGKKAYRRRAHPVMGKTPAFTRRSHGGREKTPSAGAGGVHAERGTSGGCGSVTPCHARSRPREDQNRSEQKRRKNIFRIGRGRCGAHLHRAALRRERNRRSDTGRRPIAGFPLSDVPESGDSPRSEIRSTRDAAIPGRRWSPTPPRRPRG